MTCLVRIAREEDLISVEKIFRQWLEEDEVLYFLGCMQKTLEGNFEFIDRDYHYFVAENESGKIIGIAGYRKPISKLSPFYRTFNPVEMNFVYVDSDARGQGAGTALVNKIFEEAKKNRYTEVLTRSAARFEDSGWKFYDKLGFDRAGQTNDLAENEEMQVFRKILSN